MKNDEDIQRVKDGPWVIAWRWGTLSLASVALAVGYYATMWVRVNAPTRAEFLQLTEIVQRLRDDLLMRGNQESRLVDHEGRLRKLEEESHKRFPTVRNQP